MKRFNQKVNPEELSQIGQELVKTFTYAREVYLFGSLVKGSFGIFSDVDLIVVVSESLSRKNFWKVYKELFNFFADRLPVAFDLIVTNEEKKQQLLEKFKPTLLLAKNEAYR